MKRFGSSIFAFLVMVSGCGMEQSRNFSLLSYNCQAFFDPVKDGTEYADYTTKAWTRKLYEKRLGLTAKVIKEAGMPDIVALVEIEKVCVIQDLASVYLPDYRYFAFRKREGTALGLGIMSKYPIAELRAHGIEALSPDPLRDILETKIDLGEAVITVFVNHWKSKLGDDTERFRIASARTLSARTAELLAEDPQALIAVCGDLNENADEWERLGRSAHTALMPATSSGSEDRDSLFLTSSLPFGSGTRVELYCPWLEGNHRGSYKYQGLWETIDHILVSPGFFDSQGFEYESFEVLSMDFLLNSFDEPMGWETRLGTGYSDHLPVIARFSGP